jgi:hypothetical protein
MSNILVVIGNDLQRDSVAPLNAIPGPNYFSLCFQLTAIDK